MKSQGNTILHKVNGNISRDHGKPQNKFKPN